MPSGEIHKAQICQNNTNIRSMRYVLKCYGGGRTVGSATCLERHFSLAFSKRQFSKLKYLSLVTSEHNDQTNTL